MPEYSKAPEEVLTLAGELIEAYHDKLTGGAIGFIFREDIQMKGGKRVLGSAAKVPAKVRPFVDLDFIITLDALFYRSASPLQRRALIDHELCHLDYSEEGGADVPKLVGHDFEEFRVIILRYGLWTPDLEESRESFEQALQIPLPGFLDRDEPWDTRLVALHVQQMEAFDNE